MHVEGSLHLNTEDGHVYFQYEENTIFFISLKIFVAFLEKKIFLLKWLSAFDLSYIVGGLGNSKSIFSGWK